MGTPNRATRGAAAACAGALAVLAFAPAAAQAVVNTEDPSIMSEALPERDGQLLTANDGDWNRSILDGIGPDPTTTRQWRRCETEGNGCADIPGQTGTAYRLTPDDVGRTIRVHVTATCGGCDTDEESSAPTGVVQPAPPQLLTPPAVGGIPREGAILGLFAGFWGGTPPLQFAVQWQRCFTTDPASCVNINGITGAAYTLAAGDVGRHLRVVITADNLAEGSVTVPTAMTPEIEARQATAGLRPMLPFPVIAIGGKLTDDGADVSLLRVRGPRGALVTVRCRGQDCPFESTRRTITRKRVVRIRPLERRLRAGTRIELFVTSPGTIGKYTRFRIRKGKRPARRDACARPEATKPSRCPTE